MATLHLGVVDVPYANEALPVNQPRSPAKAPPVSKAGKARKARPQKHGPWQDGQKVHSGEQTTGDVAQWLENDYHVMEAFLAVNAQEVSDEIAASVQGAMENELLGGPAGQNSYADAEQFIDQKFRDFLSSGQVETLGLPGVPTGAALRGVNHRLGLRKGPRRVSFVDTGLYMSSFKAWTS